MFIEIYISWSELQKYSHSKNLNAYCPACGDLFVHPTGTVCLSKYMYVFSAQNYKNVLTVRILMIVVLLVMIYLCASNRNCEADSLTAVLQLDTHQYNRRVTNNGWNQNVVVT